MEAVFIVAGVALLGITVIDMFKTTLTLRGAGPITSRMAWAQWRMVIAIHHRVNSERVLAYAGPGIAILTVLSWLLLQWVAWTLIFAAETSSVVEDQTGKPADFWARIYYAGYTLSTLGVGDYRPQGAVWQVLTAIAAGTGFLSISISATYLIPVVSAAAKKRELAIYIQGLGGTPTEILIAGWNGRGFPDLAQHLMALAPPIIEVAQQHLIYPVLHYFHSTDARVALTVRAAALEEAILLMECGVRPENRVSRAALAPAAEGIRTLFTCLGHAHITPTTIDPPILLLDPLRRAGIPVVSDAEYRRAIEQRAVRRQMAFSLVLSAGWGWEDVIGQGQSEAEIWVEGPPRENQGCPT